MRSFFLLVTALLFVVTTFGQAPTREMPTSEFYLKKSKSQQTAGWILLGTGVALIIGGIAEKDSVNILFVGNVKNNDDIIAYIFGAASVLSSIPLFTAAAKNKQKAIEAKLGFKNRKGLFPQHNSLVVKAQPTLVLTIRL